MDFLLQCDVALEVENDDIHVRKASGNLTSRIVGVQMSVV